MVNCGEISGYSWQLVTSICNEEGYGLTLCEQLSYKVMSYDCTYCHVTFKVFLVEISLQSHRCVLNRYQHLGEMMTLGTADAAVSLGFVEGFTLDGLLGHSGTSFTSVCCCTSIGHKL
jgi:hypothetical protein